MLSSRQQHQWNKLFIFLHECFCKSPPGDLDCDRCCPDKAEVNWIYKGCMWPCRVQPFLFSLKMILTCPPEAKSDLMHEPRDSPLQWCCERGDALLLFASLEHMHKPAARNDGPFVRSKGEKKEEKNSAGAAPLAVLNPQMRSFFKLRRLLQPLKAPKDQSVRPTEQITSALWGGTFKVVVWGETEAAD